MSNQLEINCNPAVAEKLATYQPEVQNKLEALRRLILDAAKKI